jgi:hypothetical protein
MKVCKKDGKNMMSSAVFLKIEKLIKQAGGILADLNEKTGDEAVEKESFLGALEKKLFKGKIKGFSQGFRPSIAWLIIVFIFSFSIIYLPGFCEASIDENKLVAKTLGLFVKPGAMVSKTASGQGITGENSGTLSTDSDFGHENNQDTIQTTGSTFTVTPEPPENRYEAKNASMTVLETVRRWDELSEGSKKVLQPFMLRPTDPGDAYYFGDPAAVTTLNTRGNTAASVAHPVQYTGLGCHFTIHYVVDPKSVHAVPGVAVVNAAGTVTGVVDHYTPKADWSGLDSGANGVPDYVDRVMIAAEQSYKLLTDTTTPAVNYGFPPPKADTDGFYDIYLVDLDNGIYGITFPETSDPEISYIVLENDFAEEEFKSEPEDLIRVTVCHEFFHAIQYSMDPYEDRWFMEMSSTFIEDVFADDVNDYVQYLPQYFDNFHKTMSTFNGIQEYGASLFIKFLSERFNDDNFNNKILKRIWDRCLSTVSPGSSALSAIDQTLRDTANGYDSNLVRAYKEYMIWNYFCGAREPGQALGPIEITKSDVFTDYNSSIAYASHTYRPLGINRFFYSDDDQNITATQAHYPEPGMNRSINTYPELTVLPSSKTPQYLGANFVEFIPVTPLRKHLTVTFDGYDRGTWSVIVIKSRIDGGADLEEMELDAASENGNITVEEFGTQEKYVRVTMIVMLTGLDAGLSKTKGYTYTYSATSGLTSIKDSDIVQSYAYPNPSRTGTAKIRYDIMKNADVTVRVYDVRGRLVSTLVDNENQDPSVFPGGHETVWTGINEDGEKVSNGVYYFKISAQNSRDKSESTGKIVILR